MMEPLNIDYYNSKKKSRLNMTCLSRVILIARAFLCAFLLLGWIAAISIFIDWNILRILYLAFFALMFIIYIFIQLIVKLKNLMLPSMRGKPGELVLIPIDFGYTVSLLTLSFSAAILESFLIGLAQIDIHLVQRKRALLVTAAFGILSSINLIVLIVLQINHLRKNNYIKSFFEIFDTDLIA